MRIPKSWVPIMAKKIINNLIAKELVRPNVPLDKLLVEKFYNKRMMAPGYSEPIELN